MPVDLVGSLPSHLKRALEHPLRRRILRALGGVDTTRTLGSLAETIPGVSVSSVGWHALVLEECGGVSVAIGLPGVNSGGTCNRYSSNVADDQAVTKILELTRRSDAGEDLDSGHEDPAVANRG